MTFSGCGGACWYMTISSMFQGLKEVSVKQTQMSAAQTPAKMRGTAWTRSTVTGKEFYPSLAFCFLWGGWIFEMDSVKEHLLTITRRPALSPVRLNMNIIRFLYIFHSVHVPVGDLDLSFFHVRQNICENNFSFPAVIVRWDLLAFTARKTSMSAPQTLALMMDFVKTLWTSKNE